MNLDQVPSKLEVMGWSPQQLADYLRTCDLSGCDKVVLKNSISGSRFVNLSENDLQKFPKLHTPMISKISKEIGKKEKRGRMPLWKTAPKHPEPEMPTEVQGWGEDEFDEDFDDDYESPYSGEEEGSGGDYESPTEDLNGEGDYEPPPTEPSEEHKLCPTQHVGDGEYIDNRHSHVPSAGSPPVVNPRPAIPTQHSLHPPAEPRRDPSPHGAGQSVRKFPPQPPQISRDNKPGRASVTSPTSSGGRQCSPGERPSTPSLKPPVSGPDLSTRLKAPGLPSPSTSVGRSNSSARSQQSIRPPVPGPDLFTRPKAPGLPPPSTSVNRSNSSARSLSNRFDEWREQPHDEGQKHNTFPLHNKSIGPRPGLPRPSQQFGESLPPSVPPGGSLPHRLYPATPESRSSVMDRPSFRSGPPPSSPNNKPLDPRWYVGNVGRRQAEGCLARVQKDGAYLVRDSTRQLDSQPFTLMVLYQNKVYNIQIRQENQQFLLGTGLKAQEFFPSVSEIIGHYSKSPLLLIDAKNRNSSQQNQCLLSDPAGQYITGQKWS
ncbi:lymphocyte cytosolic protein 2a isoform X2 [Salarias fasciatus]|uniref:lymphocyte cytosolic protein 2a isoform X2 n=1 Tax=Salarias fasciatus TaxID=181472 RepID=UPI001176E9CF|nr:lymphocyte cytosolic protein 2 isoform X2 [Salarias fasciatus]